MRCSSWEKELPKRLLTFMNCSMVYCFGTRVGCPARRQPGSQTSEAARSVAVVLIVPPEELSVRHGRGAGWRSLTDLARQPVDPTGSCRVGNRHAYPS